MQIYVDYYAEEGKIGEIYTGLLFFWVILYYIAKMQFSVFIVKKWVPSFLGSLTWYEIEKVIYRIKEFWKYLRYII